MKVTKRSYEEEVTKREKFSAAGHFSRHRASSFPKKVGVCF
jgi:hypothetical protein